MLIRILLLSQLFCLTWLSCTRPIHGGSGATTGYERPTQDASLKDKDPHSSSTATEQLKKDISGSDVNDGNSDNSEEASLLELLAELETTARDATKNPPPTVAVTTNKDAGDNFKDSNSHANIRHASAGDTIKGYSDDDDDDDDDDYDVRAGSPQWLMNEILEEYAVEVLPGSQSAEDVRDFLESSPHVDILSEISVSPYGTVFHVRECSGSNLMSQRRMKRETVETDGVSLEQHLESHTQVKRLSKQTHLTRDKRGVDSSDDSIGDSTGVFTEPVERVIHDKQRELPEIRYYEDKSIFHRVSVPRLPSLGGDNSQSGKRRKWKDYPFNDPFLPDQWYLINNGQADGPADLDLNVLPVWEKGFTGQGVVVTILDDGIEYTNKELRDNYDSEASGDLNDVKDPGNDPSPNKDNLVENSHGTRCAGEVAAAANNEICGVGVAFNAKIGGIRMLDGKVTDLLEARALLYNNSHIDIYSASWGPRDNGRYMEGPGRYCSAALKEGVTKGRNGLGSIFVWATGNGGVQQDDCSADGYVSSPYTVSVGSVNQQAQSMYFTETCPSTLAVVFTGGYHSLEKGQSDAAREAVGLPVEHPVLKVVTPDVGDKCTLSFQGTSSAAPLAAGCVALLLEANPKLNWRDVQHVIVQTAKIPNPNEPGWTINGAGYHVNDKFGFGVMDCGKMVELGQKWISVGPQHVCTVQAEKVYAPIVPGKNTSVSMTVEACQKTLAKRVDKLEHVQTKVKLSARQRGLLKLHLISPGGTISEILSPRPHDKYKKGIDFTFMTVHSWGENPRGTWTLLIIHTGEEEDEGVIDGYITEWSVTYRGTSELGEDMGSAHMDSASTEAPEKTGAKAFSPGSEKLERIMVKERLSSGLLDILSSNEAPEDKTQERQEEQRSLTDPRDNRKMESGEKTNSQFEVSVQKERAAILERIRSILLNADESFTREFIKSLKDKLAEHQKSGDKS